MAVSGNSNVRSRFLRKMFVVSSLNSLSGLIRVHAVAYWLRHYATSRKISGSTPEEMNDFFSSYLILTAALDPGFNSACNRNEYQRQKKNVSGE
jgi:hypothetical protein